MSKIFIYTENDSDITWENVYLSTPYKDFKHFKKENPEFRPVLSYNVKEVIGVDIEQLEQELQRTREQLEKAEKVISELIEAMPHYGVCPLVDDKDADCNCWRESDIKFARQYFQDKQGE